MTTDRSKLDAVRLRILGLCEDRGISLKSASESLGRNSAFLHQFIHKGSPRRLKEVDRSALASLLGISPLRLMDDDQKAELDLVRRPAPSSGAADLPVIGYSSGVGDDITMNRKEPVRYVSRPAGLEGAAEAYAVEVVGDRHSPRLRPGETAFVHPNRSLVPGCDAVVEFNTGRAIIALFDRMDADHIVVRRLNPPAEESYLRSSVTAVHRIVGADFIQ